MIDIRKFLTGIGLLPVSSSTIDTQGELEARTSDGQLYYHDGTVIGKVLTSTNFSGASLASPITVPNGGTGNSSLAAHGILIGANSSPVNVISTGTTGQVLTSNGASADPTFQSLTSAGVNSLNGEVGNLNLTAGFGIAITPSGTNIAISTAGGGTAAINPQVSTALGLHAVNTWTDSIGTIDSSNWTALIYTPPSYFNGGTGLGPIPAFVGCAKDNAGGGGPFVYSSDARNWTTASAPGSETDWRALAYSPQFKRIVAVNASRTTFAAATSDSNGINWSGVVGLNHSWTSITWSPDLSLFCSVADDGAVATSPTGTTWTIRTAAASNQWTSVVWSSELMLFVAVSKNGTNQVMTSPDGITWTSRNAASASVWLSLCWAPEKLLFVAVGQTGAIMTSPDGITWTSRTAGGSYQFNAVAWSPELGYFAAVSTSQIVNVSSDGITWINEPISNNNAWQGLAWGAQFGNFAAIGQGANTNVTLSRIVKKFVAP